MYEIEIPFLLTGIPLKPEMTGRLKIDETMTQTLSALCGWNGEARRLLTCAVNGALHVTTPPAKAIVNSASTGADENITFTDNPTTEVMIMANPNNTGDVWVNIGAAGVVDTGWLLSPGDTVNLAINNMQELNLFVVTSGDKVITVRSV